MMTIKIDVYIQGDSPSWQLTLLLTFYASIEFNIFLILSTVEKSYFTFFFYNCIYIL